MRAMSATGGRRNLGRVWLNRFKRLASGRTDVWLYALRTKLHGLDLGRFPSPSLVSPRSARSSTTTRADRASNGSSGRSTFRAAASPSTTAAARAAPYLTMCQFPFEEVIGVELAADLIRIAEANAAREGARQARFVNADASQFADLDRVTHLYMYHPFRQCVMDQVMENLRTSLARRPRALTLVYKNPVCHEAVLESGLFELKRTIRDEDSPDCCNLFHIYALRSEPGVS